MFVGLRIKLSTFVYRPKGSRLHTVGLVTQQDLPTERLDTVDGYVRFRYPVKQECELDRALTKFYLVAD